MEEDDIEIIFEFDEDWTEESENDKFSMLKMNTNDQQVYNTET